MRTRETVRLLILNPDGQLLLMKCDDPHVMSADGSRENLFWVTFGGGIEGNEDIFAAAAREAREETGRTDVRIGRPVWYREVTLMVKGEAILFRETYVIAHLEGGELSNDGWTSTERELIKDVRWWSVGELRETTDVVFPKRLAELMQPIVRGEYPEGLLRIA